MRIVDPHATPVRAGETRAVDAPSADAPTREHASRSADVSAASVRGIAERAATPGGVVQGYIVPGLPHPLLVPDRSPAWRSLRDSFERVATEIAQIDADLLVLYSTQWISIIGHQMQADPEPVWLHVDPEWHELGDMPYRFRMDVEFARAYEQTARARGLHARTVAYYGFPIDTGTVVALTLLNPGNRLPAGVVSCNMYADRAETLVLGKAARDALALTGKRAIAIAVTALSNRMFTSDIDPAEDRVSSLKDDEWNRKILELLGEGRLEDVSQLAREFSAQANGDQKMKAIWWLAAVMGEHNNYDGRVVDYQPIWGTGGAIVLLTPSDRPAGQLEFDEESVEVYSGERNVLGGTSADSSREEARGARPHNGPPKNADAPARAAERAERSAPSAPSAPQQRASEASGADTVRTDRAPTPVGAYPHARRVGNLLFLSGMGPRQPQTGEIPGGPVTDANGQPRAYDMEAQTRAAIENVRRVLEAAGSSLEKVLDVTAFLIDMDRDFATFNRVYAEYFERVGATRTTLAVSALPTPIAVEFKVIASIGS
jgi:2-aminophenol/2-amino-5-chlorophenol 1,6-dioxygenase alpha subunit